jgi:hypothetical protein
MRFSFPLPMLSVLVVAACTGGGDGESDKLTFSGKMAVLSIDRQAHVITTVTTSTECEDGTSMTESDTSMDHYAIAGGKLIMWDEEDCTATTLTGSSNDIVGTWKGNGIEMESAIPAEYRPAGCPATLPVDSSDADVFADAAVTYTVSEKSIEITGSGTVCLIDEMAADLVDNGFSLVSKTCSDAVLKDPAGRQMAVKTSMATNRMSISVDYRGAKCGFDTDMAIPGNAIDCAKQKAAMESYIQCLQGAAGPKVSASLRKASAKLF